jgi:predicted metal-dependent hydrolase
MDAAEPSAESSRPDGGTGRTDACDEPPPALLLKGIEEFNAGRYWECHETLEMLWRAEPRPVRDLYQGILQVGVGFHHLQRGNYAGAVKVLSRGLARLRRLPDVCQGVRVSQLADEAGAVYARLLEIGPAGIGEFSKSDLPRA